MHQYSTDSALGTNGSGLWHSNFDVIGQRHNHEFVLSLCAETEHDLFLERNHAYGAGAGTASDNGNRCHQQAMVVSSAVSGHIHYGLLCTIWNLNVVFGDE